MGLQIFGKKRYFIGENVPCSQCGGEHLANYEDEGVFICGICKCQNEYDLDSLPEINIESVLRNAHKMAGHRRRDGKISV